MANLPATGSDESARGLGECGDHPTERQLEIRYFATANVLLDDAVRNASLRILVDVLTWTLAKIIVERAGRWGAGDVMRQIGNHVCRLIERERAQEEADEAKAQGKMSQ
jgi:hypothetical protein